jgi:hypothetical protein
METGRMQQEKAGLEMQQFRRRQSALDKFLSDAEKGGYTGDPEDVAKSFFDFALTSGEPPVILAAQQALMAAKERKQYLSERMPKPPAGAATAGSEDRLGDFISQIEAKPMPMPAVTGGAPSPAANMLAPAAAPVNALAAPVDPAVALQNKIIDLEMRYPSGAAKNEIARLTKQLDNMQKSQIVAPGASVFQGGRAVYTAPERQDTDLIRNFNAAKAQGFRGDLFEYQRQIAMASRPLAPPAQPSAPVAVIDPATGQPIYVSREDALRNRMQPAANASALKPLTEGQTIKLRTDVSKDYKAATTALSQMEDLLESVDKVKTAPGLAAATGFTGKYLPSFPEGKAAQAETRLANLRGKVTALGKATAAMSGAIGSIANQEWKILSDQIAVLDEVKGAGPLLEQIALIEQQARGAIERIRDTYQKTRAEDFERFPQFRDLPAPRSRKDSGGGNIDALLDKYK